VRRGRGWFPGVGLSSCAIAGRAGTRIGFPLSRCEGRDGELRSRPSLCESHWHALDVGHTNGEVIILIVPIRAEKSQPKSVQLNRPYPPNWVWNSGAGEIILGVLGHGVTIARQLMACQRPMQIGAYQMAKCTYCKTQETQLYEDGVPICIVCSNRIQEAKLDCIEKASAAAAGGSSRADARFGNVPEYLK
jgi:hypothetical protein